MCLMHQRYRVSIERGEYPPSLVSLFIVCGVRPMFGIYSRLYSRELPNILIDQIKVGDVDDHKEDDSDEKKVKVMARHLKSNRSLRQMRPTADILS